MGPFIKRLVVVSFKQQLEAKPGCYTLSLPGGFGNIGSSYPLSSMRAFMVMLGSEAHASSANYGRPASGAEKQL